jgi:hypothetical protein
MLRARPIIALAGVDYAHDGTVVGGNMRLRAAAARPRRGRADSSPSSRDGRVPTFVVSLTETQARQWALRDNNPYGEWEDQALAEFVHQLRDSGGDLDLTGFPTGIGADDPRGRRPDRRASRSSGSTTTCPPSTAAPAAATSGRATRSPARKIAESVEEKAA